jgi:hypothetical protein
MAVFFLLKIVSFEECRSIDEVLAGNKLSPR